MPFFDDDTSAPELELGLEDDVLLSDMNNSSMTSSQQQPPAQHYHPVPKWMRSSSSSTSWSHLLRDHVYPFLLRLFRLLRPRPTILRATLLASLALYTLYRLLTAQPLLLSRLPAYTGPHGVGAVDIEVPLDPPRRVSDVTFRRQDHDGEKAPAFEVETVLFTLYYPTEKKKPAGGDGQGGEQLYWIPSPVSATARGYARFLGMDNGLVRGLLTAGLWLVSPWGIPIPAQVGAPVLAHDKESSSSSLPVMVFTHGMLSSRTDYTSYLGELASRGVVVAALEHRDGSSPGSAIRRKDADGTVVTSTWRYWFGLRDLDTSTSSSAAPPGEEKSFDTAALKEAQLSFREAEIAAAAAVLRDLNHNPDLVASQNARQPSSSSGGSSNFLSGFQNRLNTTHLLLAGHSYGGTGVLRALRSTTTIRATASDDPNPFTAALVLDPGKSSGPLNADVAVPLLLLHSASWSQTHSLFFGRPHFDVVRAIAEGVNARCGAADDEEHDPTRRKLVRTEQEDEKPEPETSQPPCNNRNAKAWFLTSLGTAHPSVTDAPFLAPWLLSWATGSTMDARDGIRQYVDLTLDFVHFQHTNKRRGPLALSDANKNTDEGGSVVVKEYDPKHNDKMPGEYRKYWQLHVAPD